MGIERSGAAAVGRQGLVGVGVVDLPRNFGGIARVGGIWIGGGRSGLGRGTRGERDGGSFTAVRRAEREVEGSESRAERNADEGYEKAEEEAGS